MSSTSTSITKTAMTDPNQDFETYAHSPSSFLSQPHLPTPTSPATPHATPPAQSWENEILTLGLQDATNNHPLQLNGPTDWGFMQQDFNLNEAFISDADLLDPSAWLSAIVLPNNSTDTSTTANITSSTVPGQHLVTLIAKMQQCLKILEHGPWQNDSANTLDDYPVGTVLHLSHEFGSIASLVLSRGCNVGTMMSREYISAIETPAAGEIHTTKQRDIDGGSDTVTTLLVLSGYMSLARIYSIVLGHFQTHLSSIPSDGTTEQHSDGVQSASTNPKLQLGELPCTSAAPVLGRIHTALRMLLAALHGVEEKLGPGGAVARNLVVALLAQEVILGTSEFQNGLSKKMQLVKELLQEKMNL